MSNYTEWSKNWCLKFLDKHPLEKKNINKVYEDTIARYLKPGIVVYDAGGGKRCRYIKRVDKESMYVFALDISDEELNFNLGVDGKFVTDVCENIPTPYGKVDMITSSYLCQHLINPKRFYKNAYKALKPYGLFINMFPCRYSVFATINRLLPEDVSKKILNHFLPNAEDDCDYSATYENLWYSKVIQDYRKAGFRVEKIYLRYLQADYYHYCIPLFLLNYLWDWIMKKLQLKNFASHMMIVARKI